MFRLFYPSEYAKDVFQIDYEMLYQKGIRGILFDIDNTLVHHGEDATPEVEELFRQIRAIGLKTLILSNNTEERVRRFLKNMDVPFVCDADKPRPQGYLKGMELLKTTKEQTLVIGDQIFTDILGANRCGLASILVQFLRLPEESHIGKRRQLERLILAFYKRNRSLQNKLSGVCRKGE